MGTSVTSEGHGSVKHLKQFCSVSSPYIAKQKTLEEELQDQEQNEVLARTPPLRAAGSKPASRLLIGLFLHSPLCAALHEEGPQGEAAFLFIGET